MEQSSIDTKSILTLIFLSLIWGSSFILIKKALVSFDNYTVGALRIAISSLAFLPFLIYHWKKVDWKKWLPFSLVGLLGSGIPAILYATAQTEVTSSVAGLLNSMTPIFTLILGIIVFKEGSSRSKMLGVSLGFFGVAMLLLFSKPLEIGGNPWYGLFILLGTICYAASVNIVKEYFQETPSLILSSTAFGMIGPPAFLFLIFSDFSNILTTHPYALKSLAAVVFLSLVGTVFSTIIFYRLVQNTNAVFASSVSYIIPVTALLWGLVDGEHLGLIHIIGLLMILSGIYLIKKD